MQWIKIHGLRQNNLKNIEVDIPIGKFTVICGPSGSGKSSLAFESLYAEGQRRYIESLSNYARQFLQTAPKPDLDSVENIPPAIALQQKNHIKNSRSTVGTTTEILDYLRLLYAKIGAPICPNDKNPIRSDSIMFASEQVVKNFSGQRAYLLTPIYKDKRVLKDADLVKNFLQEGFSRIFVDGEMKELELTTKVPKKDFFLMVDRLAISKDDQGRITDSMRTAYQAYQRYNNSIYGKAILQTTDGKAVTFDENLSCSICGYTMPPITPALFSFSSPVGACTECQGFGNILAIDPDKVIPNSKVSLAKGAIEVFNMPSTKWEKGELKKFCAKNKIDMHVPWEFLEESERQLIWDGTKDFWGVKGFFDYMETKKYKMHVRIFLARYKSPFLCKKCHGARLREEVQNIFINDKNILDLTGMSVSVLLDFVSKIQLSKMQEQIAREVLRQTHSRLLFLDRVGVGYLTLSRQTRTLSGGEYQRIHLANQLGMGLSQTLYVLDEPTIGLHPRDNLRLIGLLHDLKNLGNTLVVVEHDHDVIHSSDYVIEMGPGSGMHGGTIMFRGEKGAFLKNPDSLTAKYIKDTPVAKIEKPKRPVTKDFKNYLELSGCSGHNLKNIDVKVPMNRLVVVTGVSGSGKSSLIAGTLYPKVARILGKDFAPSLPCDEVIGADYLRDILFIDQKAVGKSSRSNPITYIGAYDEIRNIMSSTKESRERGYKPGFFSLNVDGGRCPTCKGEGVEVIDMQFLDEIEMLCEACKGKRFKSDILEVRFQGKNIYEILNMTIDEANDFFIQHPKIRRALQFLKEVGLDYIKLGQSSNSLSGGETQRLKIAKELSTSKHDGCLYILDEPTTGLHFREIDLLMKILNKLVDAGGTVILIEHNLDVIKQCDYIIDLGPEGGEGGGELLYQGNLDGILKVKESLTAKFLS